MFSFMELSIQLIYKEKLLFTVIKKVFHDVRDVCMNVYIRMDVFVFIYIIF